RMVRQLATESAMLALVGGLGGVLLSRAFVNALAGMFFATDDEGHPLSYDFSQTPAIVAATIAVALVAGLAFSVVPAIRIVRRVAAARLTERSATARWPSGAWLLGAQAAVA